MTAFATTGWFSRMKREYSIAFALALVLCVAFTAYRVINIDQLRGDSAIFFQVTDNIAMRGAPVSEVFANTQSLIDSGLLSTPADKYATISLAPPAVDERNMLHFHEYLLLYPVAVLAMVIPVDILLLALLVVSYVGLLFVAYLVLRTKMVSIIGALLFCLLVVSLPAFGQNLLYMQPFPDCWFVLLGLVFMCIATQGREARIPLLISGILCALVNERGALVAGQFLILYALLNWKKPGVDGVFKLGLGAGILLYGVLIVKFALATSEYSSFLPGTLEQAVHEFQSPVFVQKTVIFALFNLPLLLIAFFRWRSGLIALALMLPNVLGNIGGAEKTGWSTHYHVYYLSALIWAALLGYEALFRTMKTRRARIGLYAMAGVFAIFLSLLNPDTFVTPSFSPANLSNNFVIAGPQQLLKYLSPDGIDRYRKAIVIRDVIPEGSIVSTVESGMPLLYHKRTIRAFPMGIDQADYAVLNGEKDGGKMVYSGASNNLSTEEEQKTNKVVLERMRRDGYDFGHPIIIQGIGTVIKRIH